MNKAGFAGFGALCLLLAFGFGFGIWRSMSHVRAIVQRQVNLDRCSGSEALALRSLLRVLRDSFTRLKTARAIALPLLLTPEGPQAFEAFRLVARMENRIQWAVKLEWEVRGKRWDHFPGLGCGLHNTPLRSPYPGFDFPIVNPDLGILDLQSLHFDLFDNTPRAYSLWIRVAKLETEASIVPGVNHDWKTRWTR